MKVPERIFGLTAATVFLLSLACGQAWGQANEELAGAVEMELQEDPVVPFNRIDVAARDGTVTLSGKVANIQAKERASRVAATVKGVKGVLNDIEVTPASNLSDKEIASRVRNALLRNPATDTYELEVNVLDGIVTLDGTVDSFQESELAIKVAMGVNGVTGVINELDILNKGQRPDAEIRHDIQQTLRMDVLVDNALIDVQVDGGDVTLSGTVGSLAEKNFAVADAQVLGVNTVDASRLKVDPSIGREKLRGQKYRSLTDRDVEQGIESGLILNPWVDADNVTLSVKDGVATLRGTVESLYARRQAAEEARLTVGVSRVRNNLKVRFGEAVEDQEIEKEVRNALIYDPWVDKYEITVDVINGTAFLSGLVDSYYEKNQAELVASTISGVEDVNNNLVVSDEDDLLVYDPYLGDDYYYDYDWYTLEPSLAFESDSEIKEDINDQLFWSPFVDANQVEIEVTDGTAILTGTVDSWAEKNAAVENAFEGGALWVRDRTSVK